MGESSTVYFPDPGKEIHRRAKLAALTEGEKLGDFVAQALTDRAEKILSGGGSQRKQTATGKVAE